MELPPKKSHLVVKPFAKGNINIFNPPKSNPNGRLASSKLFKKDISDEFPESSAKNPEKKSQGWNFWSISGFAMLILANSMLTFAVLKEKASIQPETQKPEPTPKLLVGKTNLTNQEFIPLNINSLSQISPNTSQDKVVTNKSSSQVITPLPIPPNNLSQKAISNSQNIDSSYYYVLVKYTGDKSLKLASQQVENVSLVNLDRGTFIYLGAFTKFDLAAKFLDKINKMGLSGQIYPHASK